MKTALLASLLFLGLIACSKSSTDPTPPTAQQRQQQLLLGTWKLEKSIYTHSTSSGVLVFQDSTFYPTPDPNYTITYKADGTTISGVGTTGFYTYNPPTLIEGVADPNFTVQVVQLTTQKCVMTSRLVTSGAIITGKHFYAK